jgi:hypothetical protein
VPNSFISKNQPVNYTLPNSLDRIQTHAGIGYGTDINTAEIESLFPSLGLNLQVKPETEQPSVPKYIVETYVNVGQARGKLGVGEVIGLEVMSDVDRLLASRKVVCPLAPIHTRRSSPSPGPRSVGVSVSILGLEMVRPPSTSLRTGPSDPPTEAPHSVRGPS